MGDGDRLLLCFHGYGQSRKLFRSVFPVAPIGWRVVMIDLIFFGESTWGEEAEPVPPDIWDHFLHQLVELHACREVHFLAYSLGAKIALTLYQTTAIQIHSMTLISPDGLKIHPLYHFCMYHPLGRRLFGTVMRWPGLLRSSLWVLYRLRITDAFKYKFVSRQFHTAEKRQLLKLVWKGHSLLRPDLGLIAKRSSDTGTRWHIVWGEDDDILPVNLCRDFIRKVNCATLHVVPGGHFLLNQPTTEVRTLLNAILSEE
ncbi:MAG: hypothetical protein RLZZ165_2038 [Bacteroidota bacterium]